MNINLSPGFLSEIRTPQENDHSPGEVRARIMATCHRVSLPTLQKMRQAIAESGILMNTTCLTLECDISSPNAKEIAKKVPQVQLPTFEHLSQATKEKKTQGLLEAIKSLKYEEIFAAIQSEIRGLLEEEPTPENIQEWIRWNKELAQKYQAEGKHKNNIRIQKQLEVYEVLLKVRLNPSSEKEAIEALARERAKDFIEHQAAFLEWSSTNYDEFLFALFLIGLEASFKTCNTATASMEIALIDVFKEKTTAPIVELETLEDNIICSRQMRQKWFEILGDRLSSLNTAEEFISCWKKLQKEEEGLVENIWLTNDEEANTTYIQKLLAQGEQASGQLEKRNLAMSEKIDQMLRDKKSVPLIAIGINHLHGNRGVVALLKSKGWSINPI